VARTVFVWLVAAFAYCIVFAGDLHAAWIVVDVAIFVVVGLALLLSGIDLAGIARAALAIALVLVTQLLIADRNGIWIDESNYLATLDAGHPLAHGTLPFCARWLEPVLAGALNVLPARGADALKALNFGALVVACVELDVLAIGLGAARRVAHALPVFLMCSYLGTYAATNRLVVDPFNYAMFAVVLRAFVSRDRERYVPWLLLVAACNSEKAIYWLLVVGAAELMRTDLRRAVVHTLRAGAPMLAYFVLLALYMHGASHDDSGTFVEQLQRMALTPQATRIDDPVAAGTTFQMLWFPFGPFTIFALLALVSCRDRKLLALPLLLVPIMAQVLIASDERRMVAYAFIVYLPLGALYVTRALATLPRALGTTLLAAFVAIAACQYYLFPLAHGLHHKHAIQLALAALELVATGALVWLDAVFDRRQAC
jgi:hypothetical protein